MAKTPVAFRLSDQALKNLETICRTSGVNQTAVVEMALAALAQGLTKGEVQMSKTQRKRMINHLNNLGVDAAIADRNATSEGNPAILLRWNGQEEYYTGFDMDGDQSEYRDWLTKTFANK